jgi:uroporphyrin-III C-methyltransferase
MADNQDKLSPKDQQMLEDLEKQLTQSSSSSSAASASASASKGSPSDDKEMPKKVFTAKSTKAEPPPQVVKTKTGFLWFFTLINLFLLTAVILAAYWAWMQWQNQQQKQEEFFALQESRLITQQEDFTRQKTELAAAIAANKLVKDDWQMQSQSEQQRLDLMANAIQQNSQQVASNLDKINDIAGRRPADWLLAEANYLLNIAGRKLWLEHDVKTSLFMLQAADSRLQDVNDTSLLAVREKLASDIVALQQITPLSTTSIALSISGLAKQIDSLPLAYFHKPEPKELTTEISADEGDWQSNLMKSINHVFEGFFRYEKITTEIKPFMSEQQQWLVQQQLRFLLLSAQTAALQEKWPVFTDALNNASNLLSEHFDGQQASVIQFNDNLQTLLASDLEMQYPSQFTASNALQDAIDSRLGNRFTNGNN